MSCEEAKEAKEEAKEESKDEGSSLEECFSDRKCIKCKILLQPGWLDRCENCIDPKYVGYPCLNCERRGLDIPALLGTYYCRECREEEIEGERERRETTEDRRCEKL